MKARLIHAFKQIYGAGRIEGVIWDVPMPVPPGQHKVKYRLVYIEGKQRIVGYDNERGKGDHKHIREVEIPYVFVDVPTLLSDFMKDVEEVQRYE
ncbi:conserved hypothetical protein [Candidatus Glomeribacter gigasporarum BEG34]|uniref:Uncharacterized protein n=1 Tax=Candidatus Glomeribacter gigasporarum BEG34 TaxID=1070319 RepID=G2JBA6_9BURK|nr:DUF6516 family protein [Candidatus Glomeribacter gigasporarum]CCD30060.1 conserved hypothetical protein [Candidatus Glomeribacter gigasporarum BEG34]